MNTKIVLVGINTRHSHNHLSLGYLEAWLKQKYKDCLDITRLDLDGNKTFDSLFQEIVLLKPRIVAFSTYIWSHNIIIALAGALKAAFPNVTIILGGPEVSFQASKILNSYSWVDIIVRGEGEITFEEVIIKLLENKRLDGTLGISYRSEDGKILHELDRPLIENLDIIPSPFLLELYGKGQGFTYYESTRGCPYRCSYCLSSVLGKLRKFSLDRVKAELEWFMNSNYTQVRFADRTFNHDTSRAIEILEYILKNNKKNIGFHFELKADLLNDEIIDVLAKAPENIFHLEIGIQSTHNKTLEAVDRITNLEKLKENIIKLREKTKCHIHLDLLAGLPYEDYSKFCNTLDDAFGLKCNTIQVGLVKVLPGTKLENYVKEDLLSCSPTPLYQVVKTKWLQPEEIVKIHDIGKLVEGIYNSKKFKISLEYITKRYFEGRHSTFYEKLASFWRKNKKNFHSFTIEVVSDGLRKFVNEILNEIESNNIISKTLQYNEIDIFNDILTHEIRLNQKVPSGSSSYDIINKSKENNKTKIKYKLNEGYKLFWYKYDIIEIINLIESNINISYRNFDLSSKIFPAPIVYHYEKDLSKPINTSMLKLDLLDRLVLGIITKENFDEEQLKEIVMKVLGIRNFDINLLSKIIDKLLKNHLIFESR